MKVENKIDEGRKVLKNYSHLRREKEIESSY
jgi:hypothetical protein